MAKSLRDIVSKKEDHLRSKTPWEYAHKDKMRVAKLDDPANHEANFKAVSTKVYDRKKDNYGNPPEPACPDGSYGTAPDMAKEEVEEEDDEELRDEANYSDGRKSILLDPKDQHARIWASIRHKNIERKHAAQLKSDQETIARRDKKNREGWRKNK